MRCREHNPVRGRSPPSDRWRREGCSSRRLILPNVSLGLSLLRIQPVVTDADIHDQRNGELGGVLHLVTNELAQ
jgi:hypothetical protein